MAEKAGEAQLIQADRRVTAYQAAARIYCAKISVNPDQQVNVPHETLAGVATVVPFWYTIAERMFDLSLLIRCMSEADKAARAANDPGAHPPVPPKHQPVA
jgi:hypothetical protein